MQLHFFSENHEAEGSNTKPRLIEPDNLSHMGASAQATMKSLRGFNVIVESMPSGTVHMVATAPIRHLLLAAPERLAELATRLCWGCQAPRSVV